MPNERHYSNELNLESVGINLPYNMQAEQSVLGAVPVSYTHLDVYKRQGYPAAGRQEHRSRPGQGLPAGRYG